MIYRQGDLTFIRTGDTAGSEPLPTPTKLAEGDLSGHWHEVTGATVLRVGDKYVLDVPVKAVVQVQPATHAGRHAPVTLPAGRYEVPGVPSDVSVWVGQREYTPMAIVPSGD